MAVGLSNRQRGVGGSSSQSPTAHSTGFWLLPSTAYRLPAFAALTTCVASAGPPKSYEGGLHTLQDLLFPVLQAFLYFSHELVRRCTIDQTMVEGQGQIHHGTDGDSVIHHDRTLVDTA